MDGGCPFDRGRDKVTLKFTLVDFLDTSQEELEKEGHTSGAKCKCRVCLKLKLLEDKFILKSGTFYRNGLNTRNELQNGQKTIVFFSSKCKESPLATLRTLIFK